MRMKCIMLYEGLESLISIHKFDTFDIMIVFYQDFDFILIHESSIYRYKSIFRTDIKLLLVHITCNIHMYTLRVFSVYLHVQRIGLLLDIAFESGELVIQSTVESSQRQKN